MRSLILSTGLSPRSALQPIHSTLAVDVDLVCAWPGEVTQHEDSEVLAVSPGLPRASPERNGSVRPSNHTTEPVDLDDRPACTRRSGTSTWNALPSVNKVPCSRPSAGRFTQVIKSMGVTRGNNGAG